jgi:hypothetical protein
MFQASSEASFGLTFLAVLPYWTAGPLAKVPPWMLTVSQISSPIRTLDPLADQPQLPGHWMIPYAHS